MRRGSVLYRFLTIAAAGLFVACGDDPTPVKPTPLTPSEVAGIEVIGPDSLVAGQVVQFVAKIRQADGTTKSATSMPNLKWRSSDPSLLLVSNSGMVTVADPGFDPVLGEATIIAEMTSPGAVQGTRKVVIQPGSFVSNGPYSLSVTAQNVTARSQLSVSWVAPSGRSPADWIAIFKAGSGNEAWNDIWWDYTGGSSKGTFTISAPAEPGLYEFRYFLDDGFEVAVKSSLVTVTAEAPARHR
jgi:hypothetical protein